MSEKKTYVWEALHNPMIHESSFYTISIHRTKGGALQAIKESKKLVKKEHDKVYSEEDEYKPKWDKFHKWMVKKTEVLSP